MQWGTRAVADGQAGIVGENRSGSDQDGVAFGPEAVYVGACCRRGDPLAQSVSPLSGRMTNDVQLHVMVITRPFRRPKISGFCRRQLNTDHGAATEN